jgi:ribosomal protein S18 acetylase RimI-like enzyme
MVIRPTQKIDAHSISSIYVQTWRDTYLSLIPYDYLWSMSTARHERAFFDELDSNHSIGFVAEDAGRVVGFVTGGYERHADPVYSGEIYTLYVLRNLQRRGIGTELVCALAGQFGRLGIYSMLVRVLKLNPYRRFYEKRNGIHLKSEHQLLETEVLDVQVYGWPDTTLIAD